MMLGEALSLQNLFIQDRPILDAHDQPHTLLKLLKDELHELEVALATNDRQEIASELADVAIFLHTLSSHLHIHLPTEVAEKVAFNMTRYTASLFQGDLPYEEARRRAKTDEHIRKRDFYGIPREDL